MVWISILRIGYLLFLKRNLSARTINTTIKIILKNSVSFILSVLLNTKSMKLQPFVSRAEATAHAHPEPWF